MCLVPAPELADLSPRALAQTAASLVRHGRRYIHVWLRGWMLSTDLLRLCMMLESHWLCAMIPHAYSDGRPWHGWGPAATRAAQARSPALGFPSESRYAGKFTHWPAIWPGPRQTTLLPKLSAGKRPLWWRCLSRSEGLTSGMAGLTRGGFSGHVRQTRQRIGRDRAGRRPPSSRRTLAAHLRWGYLASRCWRLAVVRRWHNKMAINRQATIEEHVLFAEVEA